MADADLLESVEQFVNDENKIVSYEFLSQTCGVHVNLAKNVLEKFVDKLKSKKGGSIDDFEVVYSVGGFLGKNLSILLVTGATLEETKSKFDKVLYSHVYSIQKGKLASFSLLYESNKTELKQTVQQCTGHSSIFCPSAKLKTAEELAANKPKPEPPAPKKAPDAAPQKSKPEPLKEANEINNQQQQSIPPADTIKKATANKPAIATFFAKHHVKDPENKKKVEEAKKKEEESKKQNNKSLKRVVREPSDDEEDDEDMEVDDAVDQKKVTNGSSKRFKLAEEEKPVVKAPVKSSKVAKSKKGKKESPKSGKPQRKRIQQVSDSSDEGEDDDVMVSSPEMAIQPAPELEEEDEDILEATIVEETKSQKNKGRKLVSKTVMDDDGFVVTTKEYVPCDVEEEEAPAVKGEKEVPSVKTEAAPAKAAKKPSPPAKGKQQSIRSFFTRK